MLRSVRWFNSGRIQEGIYEEKHLQGIKEATEIQFSFK
jgi:hypothetical protein